MLISDLENYLEGLRHRHGDIEIHEAVKEYGHKDFTIESLASFIRIEQSYFKKEDITKHSLVVGRH